jgi:hypothetical protein
VSQSGWGVGWDASKASTLAIQSVP